MIDHRRGYMRVVSGLFILFAVGWSGVSQAKQLTPYASSCGRWHIVAQPSPATRDGALYAAAALSPTDIWAVGSDGLIERWNGRRWAMVITPKAASAAGALLNAVTAVSADDVWLVGAAGNRPLSLHWDGSHWRRMRVPIPSGGPRSSLSGVAAVSSNDVWAVGEVTGRNNNDRPLIEHWNGTRWHRVAGPAAARGDLNAVAAISNNNVWAVGTSADELGLAEHWNGKRWKVVHVAPSPATGPSNMELNGLAAVSAKDVWAVGDIGGGASTVIQHWNGAKWNITADVHASGILDTVVAISAHDVWAAGIEDVQQNERAFLEHWDGSAWVRVKPAHATGLHRLPNDQITALAATSASDVWAVGSSYLDGDQTLTERWNGGRWRVVSSPSPKSRGASGLAAVSVSGSADGWAVGSRLLSGTNQPLTAQWNGARWTIVPSVIVPATSSELTGVASISPTDAWAVGNVTAFSGQVRPLVAHWNGRRWVQVTVPAPAGGAILYSVAAVSKSDVWAVGAGGGQPVIEHWNGSTWQLTYDPTGPGGELHGVSVVSANDVWAAGFNSGPLTEHWDGKIWHTVTAPTFGDESYLFAVGAAAPGAVWSVGDDLCDSTCNGGLLIERWDGQQWSVAYSPDNGNDELYAVAALSATNVWAVGYRLDSLGRQHGLSMHWNGTIWKDIRTAKTASDTELDGVTGSGRSVWAVGDSGPTAVVEQFNACTT